jgi:hypothetical protein
MAMGNGGEMGGKMAKGLQWVMGQRRRDGQHNRQRTIANNAEAAQWDKATGDVRQQQSQWTAAARLPWTAAAAMAVAAQWAAGRRSDHDG